jgi:hypothetical protein
MDSRRKSDRWLPAVVIALIVTMATALLIMMVVIWSGLKALQNATDTLQLAASRGEVRTEYEICAFRLQNQFDDLISGLVLANIDNKPTKPWADSLRVLPSAKELCEPLLGREASTSVPTVTTVRTP